MSSPAAIDHKLTAQRVLLAFRRTFGPPGGTAGRGRDH